MNSSFLSKTRPETSASPNANSTMSASSSLQVIQEAFAYIPLEEKLGLMEAIQTSLPCVLAESNPTTFLRLFAGNPLAAAQRLCRYWKERTRVFPGQRAFAPLQLSAEDLRTIQEQPSLASCRLLPKDAAGASVLWYDTAHLAEMTGSGVRSDGNPSSASPAAATTTSTHNRNNGASPASAATGTTAMQACRSRVLFFLLQQMVDNPVNQTEGCVCVLRLDTTARAMTAAALPSTTDPAQTDLARWLADVFPLRIKALHVVATSSPQQQQGYCLQQQSSLASSLSNQMREWEAALRKSAILHAGSDEGTVMTSLRNQCLVMEGGLPQQQPVMTSSMGHDSAPAASSPSFSTATMFASGLRTLLASSPAARIAAAAPATTDHSEMAKSGVSSAAMLLQQGVSSSLPNRVSSQASAPTAEFLHGPPPATPPNPTASPPPTSRSDDTPAMRQQGLEQLYEAISFMADSQKAAYLEAQRVCPELVKLESNPLKFLR